MLVDGLHGRIMLDPRIRPPLRLVRVVVESLEYAPRRLLLVLHYFFEGGIVVHAGHDILSPMVVVIWWIVFHARFWAAIRLAGRFTLLLVTAAVVLPREELNTRYLLSLVNAGFVFQVPTVVIVRWIIFHVRVSSAIRLAG